MDTRIEKDSMGEMEVPSDALWGASTERAVRNFPVSSLRFQSAFISALGIIKAAAAEANQKLSLLERDKAEIIIKAAEEVAEGKLSNHFVVDIFQTGSGTSTNMNANEVIANRALELSGKGRGERNFIHPNDHVNMSQSSNDVIPTAISVSALSEVKKNLLPALVELHKELDSKSKKFSDVVKSGRTHLQDATPITLGQEFSGYAAQIELGIERLEGAFERFSELALGGTAVGTGLNTHPDFPKLAIEAISRRTGISFRETRNHFQAQAAQENAVELSGHLRSIALSLLKIANDIRMLGSGPRCNIFELQLPEIQPGSSIMPAKVNPVVCESVMMGAAHVVGCDAAIVVGAQHGNFELNTMLPVIGYNLLCSIEVLAGISRNFARKCIAGLEANKEKCLEYAEKSLATCTSLAPIIGYDAAAKVAKQAYAEDKTVRQVVEELGLGEKAKEALDLIKMTKPGL
jgi:fumarate hydratase class II